MHHIDVVKDCLQLANDSTFFAKECANKDIGTIQRYVSYNNLKSTCLSSMESLFLDIPTDCLREILDYTSDFKINYIQTNINNPTNIYIPIHMACSKGRIDIVEYLLSLDVNINGIDSDGQSPLYIAAKYGHSKLVKFLLERGATDTASSIIFFFSKPLSPLSIACEKGYLDVVIELLNYFDINRSIASINPDIEDNNALYLYEYGSALWYSCKYGHIRIVRYLLQKGATIQYTNSEYGSIYMAAAISGRTRILEEILKYVPTHSYGVLNFPSPTGVTPLICATYYNNIDMVKFLLKCGVNPLERNNNGVSSYMWASTNKSYKLMELLEQSGGADYNGVQWNAFFSAASSGDIQLLNYFLNRGVNINIKLSHSGDTAMHLCVKAGHLSAVKYLYENGANINSKNNMDYTPLALSIIHGYENIFDYILTLPRVCINSLSIQNESVAFLCIKFAVNSVNARRHMYINMFSLLVHYGINLSIRITHPDHGYVNIFELILLLNEEDLFYLIINKVKYINTKCWEYSNATPLLIACNKGAPIYVIKKLLSRGANIDDLTSEGFSCLYFAIKNKDVSLIKYLLQKGAVVNHNIKNCTLLQIAMLEFSNNEYRYSIIDLLVSHGADIYAKSYSLKTLLMVAASIGDTVFINFCILKGCNINDVDKSGESALIFAASNGHLESVKLLVEKGANINIKNKYNKTALDTAINSEYYDISNYLFKYYR
jgi:ankyrin repeat protein